MAKIIINNPEEVVREADNLNANLDSMESVRVSAKYILDELVEYWAVNPDQQAFDEAMREEVDSLEKIIQYTEEFAREIKSYINSQSAVGDNAAPRG